MAGIWTARGELIAATGEIAGQKSGLALTRDELRDLVPATARRLWAGSDADVIRIRAEEFESLIASILHALGNIPTDSTATPGIALLHKYRNSASQPIFAAVFDQWNKFLRESILRARSGASKTIDPTPFLEQAERTHGLAGALIALELVKGTAEHQHRSPWSSYRRVEWTTLIELEELFSSESLQTDHGAFVDQRYLDYLAQNFDAVDRINWRKFEGITAEFFERAGYRVELGPGRDDGNVDVRVWPTDQRVGSPPAVLVQCKRQKSKVGKVVVKALWADVVAERAESGLIVTTSCLAPGAAKTCVARAYPIAQIDRAKLRQWLEQLRTPGTGIFLGL